MNKKRIIPVLLAMGDYLVRSQNFDWHQKLGNLTAQVERYSQWNLDELIYIDIGLTRKRREGINEDEYKHLRDIARVCRMPLTFGGGIASINDAERIFYNGADKVVLSTSAVRSPDLIRGLADKFGSQAVCVSLDIKKVAGKFILTSDAGKVIHHRVNICDHIKKCEDMGCGEFLLHAIHNDGSARGFDIDLVNEFLPDISVPTILCGGAGSARHFDEVLTATRIGALAAGNFFNFKELSYPMLKSYLYRKYQSHIRKP